jgi:hypothetical protein
MATIDDLRQELPGFTIAAPPTRACLPYPGVSWVGIVAGSAHLASNTEVVEPSCATAERRGDTEGREPLRWEDSTSHGDLHSLERGGRRAW